MSKVAKVFKKVFGFVGKIFGFKKVTIPKTSNTYSDQMATLTSNTAPIPLIYGTMKTAGNKIYSRLNSDKTVTYQLIVFGDGEVESISDLKFNDEPADSSKFIGVSYNFYLGNGTQEIDSRVEGADNEERAKVVGGLRWDAYVALQAKANDNLNGSFNVTVIVKGRKVKVYSTPTKYSFQWSDNPAWCVLDFMTCYNGCGMKEDEINIQSFIDAASFYSKYKYTLNIILDETKSRLEWLNLMLACCRSSLIYQNGKYAVFVEKAAEPVQHFDSTNTNDLCIQFSERSEVPDLVVVKYVDPEQEWAKIGAQAIVEDLSQTPPRKEEMELIGVTNFDQASRLAWFYLNQAQTCKTHISFTTNRRALDRTVGDVITYSDYICEWVEKKFRIISIEDSADGDIRLTCREYNENIYNEQRGETDPTINFTKLEDPQQNPPPIEYVDNEQEYYILPDRTVVSKVTILFTYPPFSYDRSCLIWYRKKGTSSWTFGGEFPADDGKATMSGFDIYENYEFRFIHESIFGKRSAYTYSPSIYIDGKNAPPSMPNNFNIKETVGGATISWDAVNDLDLDHYELYLNRIAEETKIANVTGNTYYYVAGAGEYFFLLISVDTVGNKSNPVSGSLVIAKPGNVTGFSCIQNERNIEFSWNKVDGASYYEIREGESWELAQPIATAAGETYNMPFAQESQIQFWIKAYTQYGVSCEIASYTTTYVAAIPNRNAIYEYNAVEDGWNSGSLTFTHVNSYGLQLDDKASAGEYVYYIGLDQKYTCRNWVEKTILPFAASDDLKWQDIGYSWRSEEAKSRVWIPLSKDFSFRYMTQIAVDSEIPTSLTEYWTLDNTLVSSIGTQPVMGIGAEPKYEGSQYHDGLLLDGNSNVKWDNVDFGTTFSLKFTAKMPAENVYNYIIAMLKNENGDTMVIKYDKNKDSFVVETSTKERVEVADFSLPKDYISFIVSQGNGYLNFLVYSAFYDKYQFAKIEYKNPKSYTSLALFADY